MSRNGARPNEAAIFKKRCEELFAKEARCPACAKAKRLAGDSQAPKICWPHQAMRNRMAFG